MFYLKIPPPGHLCSQQQTGGIRRSQSTSQVKFSSCLFFIFYKEKTQFKTWNYSWMKQASQVETEKPVKLQEPLVPKTVQVNT